MTTSSTPQGAPSKGEVGEAVTELRETLSLSRIALASSSIVRINRAKAEKYADLLTRQQARIEELEEDAFAMHAAISERHGSSELYTLVCAVRNTRSAAESALSHGGERASK